MRTAHLVHGFNTSDGGAGTLDKLRPLFEARGFVVVEHDSHWSRGIIRDLLSVRFGNTKRAESLAQFIQPDDILVGHSNGCAIIMMACWILAQINPAYRVRCVFFNPAMDRDAPVSPIISNVLCFHTKSDRVVWASSLLPFHLWGRAGQLGLNGSVGSNVHNCPYESLGLNGMGHSGIFKKEIRIKKAMIAVDNWLEES